MRVRGPRTTWRGSWTIGWSAAAALATLALLLGTRPALAEPPADIFARVAPAVPVVETELGHGTGFMVDAHHVTQLPRGGGAGGRVGDIDIRGACLLAAATVAGSGRGGTAPGSPASFFPLRSAGDLISLAPISFT